MNNEKAKEMVENELKKEKYVLAREKNVDKRLFEAASISFMDFVAICIGAPIAGSMGVNEMYGVLAGTAIVIPLSVGVVHLVNNNYPFSKEERLNLKKDNYNKKILLGYKRSLKKGNNPLEEIEDSYEEFQNKLNNDTEQKYAKKIKLK